MEIQLCSIKKKVNSTKRPDSGVTRNVAFKEATDMLHPIIRLSNIEPFQYNYCIIGDHYYFIVGQSVTPNNWLEIECEVDAMATCADDIKGTTAFVTRYSGGSLDIIDSFAPPKTSGKISYEAEKEVFSFDNVGTFIVSVADMPYPVSMSLGNMFALYNALNSKEATQQVENQYSDLSGYIRGAIWIPYQVPTLGALTLKAGDYDTGVSVNYIARETLTKEISFSLPLDDTILSSSQYCSLSLSLPYAGTASLSVDDFRDGKSVDIIATMDTTNGAISYYITSGSNLKPVASFSGSCGVPIAIGSTSYSLGSGVSSFISGLAYAMAEKSGSAFFQASHSASQTGGGGFRTDIKTASVGLIKRDAPEALSNKSNVIGLPTMRTMSLGSIKGYVECHNASIESTFEKNTVEVCNNYLNTGAWIE